MVLPPPGPEDRDGHDSHVIIWGRVGGLLGGVMANHESRKPHGHPWAPPPVRVDQSETLKGEACGRAHRSSHQMRLSPESHGAPSPHPFRLGTAHPPSVCVSPEPKPKSDKWAHTLPPRPATTDAWARASTRSGSAARGPLKAVHGAAPQTSAVAYVPNRRTAPVHSAPSSPDRPPTRQNGPKGAGGIVRGLGAETGALRSGPAHSGRSELP